MSKTTAAIYALIGLGLVLWWAISQSAVPLVLLLVLVAVVAVHIIRRTGGSDAATKHAVDEGKARAGFPSPPERPI